MSGRRAAPLLTLALLAATGALALLLAGCSRAPQTQAASEAILVRGAGPEPDSLDPQILKVARPGV